MVFQELIKNFEGIRAYMRDFYVYGFKSRRDYDAKSARSYDDERRRVESWLGDYMKFTRTPEGKAVFLSVDSRTVSCNPFYKAWKARSFTDGDITLHFLLFDILYVPEIQCTLQQLLEKIDDRLETMESPMTFDESTLRKKLKEYAEEGLIRRETKGRRVYYSRTPETDLIGLEDCIDFFSEAAPCGVVGSFLQDRLESHSNPFVFKHHYMTGALDSEVMAGLFDAMGRKCWVRVTNFNRRSAQPVTLRLVPLKIFISVETGRQHLLAWQPEAEGLRSYRLDYLSHIQLEEECPDFDRLRKELQAAEEHLWGVSCPDGLRNREHIEFEVRVGAEELYILRRLNREKRCGRVEPLDARHYRFQADVCDANELLPWIRTFLCRITRFSCSNPAVEQTFRADLQTMYRLYGLEGGAAE